MLKCYQQDEVSHVQMLAMPLYETKVRVRYSETDQMGIVHHANYLVWMEIGRVELVRSLGIDYQEMESQQGLLLSVVEANCRYLSPAKYDQEVAILTQVQDVNSRLIRFAYTIHDDATRQLLASGTTKHIWLNRAFRPTKLPDHYLQKLRPTTQDQSS